MLGTAVVTLTEMLLLLVVVVGVMAVVTLCSFTLLLLLVVELLVWGGLTLPGAVTFSCPVAFEGAVNVSFVIGALMELIVGAVVRGLVEFPVKSTKG